MSLVSALPVHYDLQVTRGTDNTLEFTLTTAAGIAINISPDTVTLTVRTVLGAARLFQIINAAGGHSDPTNGKTQFAVTKMHLADATNLTRVTTWIYEVRRQVGGAGAEIVWFAGTLELHPTGGTGA